MSIHPNTFIEPFPKISQSSVKDIWSVTPVSTLDEIHKDMYMKLSKQAEEITALTKLCETFKAQADEASSLKVEIESLKRAQVEMKAEMSSLLSGDFYIHAGGSPHGKISTNSGGTAGYCSLLSQDHLINVFTGYDVAADGTVKVNCAGKDNRYPLMQRWSFERATDKLINHPDGSGRLISIPLDT